MESGSRLVLNPRKGPTEHVVSSPTCKIDTDRNTLYLTRPPSVRLVQFFNLSCSPLVNSVNIIKTNTTLGKQNREMKLL